MINFCHIAPTPHLERLTKYNQSHLILAHLIDPEFNDGKEYDPRYAEFYATRHERGDKRRTTMDNSAFEMVKHNDGVFYEPNRLIEMGKIVKADEIVLTDYPAMDWRKTQMMAIEQIPQFKEAGFDTFYVPQSEIGDMDGYIKSVQWALNNPMIDTIGISILGVPNAFGDYEKSDTLQRSFSRIRMMQMLEDLGLLDQKAFKRFHFLGANDNMFELRTLHQYEPFIKSSDSSVAVWRGLNFEDFDTSPTGMKNGKFELPVDFNAQFDENAVKNAEKQISIWNASLI